MKLWRRRVPSFDEFTELSVYNAEVARGLVHTPEMDVRMADLNAEWMKRQAELWRKEYPFVVELPGGGFYLSKRAVP